MKKLLKTFVVCFMAFISIFTFVACDIKIEDPNNPGQDESEESTLPKTAEECFAKIKNLASVINPANGYRLDITSGEELSVDYSNSNFEELGLTDEDSINALKEDIDAEMTSRDYLDKAIIEYNATDKTGYTLYCSDDNITSYDVYNDEYLYISRVSPSSQADVMPISRLLPDKYKLQVDGEYYNQYMYDFNKSLENLYMCLDNDSLDDLQTFVLTKFKLQRITSTPTFTFNFSEKDNIVTLNIKVELKDAFSSLGVATISSGLLYLNNITKTMELTIKFNDTEILDIVGKETYIGSTSLDVEDYLDNAEALENELAVDMTLTNLYGYVIADYDGENKPEIVDTEFVPSGNNGELEKSESLVTLYIDGYYCESNYREMGEEMDKSNMFNHHDGVTFYDKIDNMTDITWYIDKECTIPYTRNTYPSYDINLYAKFSDIDLKEGEVLLIEATVYTYDENVDYSKYITNFSFGGGKDLSNGQYYPTYWFSANGQYSCVYINGEKKDTTNTYYLDSSKINVIINILKPASTEE